MDRFKKLLRTYGLVPFGYTQEGFHSHHQLLCVWGLFLPARFEVYRWPVGTGSSDMEDWMKPLPFGSPEAYHRIQHSAERVYSGKEWSTATLAFAGMYPDGTTDVTRPKRFV